MKPFSHNPPTLILLLCALLAVITAACTPTQYGRQSQLMQQASKQGKKQFGMSPAELRFRLNDLAGTFSGTIEETADLIIDGTSDPEIRHRALLWKINAIPEGHRALFHTDPAIALLDFWIFTIQMTDFFDDDADKSGLGPLNALAHGASLSLQNETKMLAQLVIVDDDVSYAEGRLKEEAVNHPIRSSSFYRESAIPDLSTKAGERVRGAFETVGNLSTDLEDLTFRMSVYAELLPKQARWQAELMVDNQAVNENISTGINSLADITESMKRIAVVADQLTDIFASERQVALKSLRKERLETIEALNDIRIETQRFVSGELDDQMAELKSERSTVTDILKEERVAVMQVFSDQVKIVLQDIDRQREISLKEIEMTGQRLTVDAVAQSKKLIDHFFWRALQLSVLLLLGVLLIVAVLWKLVNKQKQI